MARRRHRRSAAQIRAAKKNLALGRRIRAQNLGLVGGRRRRRRVKNPQQYAASVQNLKKARRVRRRRRVTYGGGAQQGGSFSSFIRDLGSKISKANHFLTSSKVISRGLKAASVPVAAFNPAWGSALQTAGHTAASYGYGAGAQKGGRRYKPAPVVYDAIGNRLY